MHENGWANLYDNSVSLIKRTIISHFRFLMETGVLVGIPRRHQQKMQTTLKKLGHPT